MFHVKNTTDWCHSFYNWERFRGAVGEGWGAGVGGWVRLGGVNEKYF